MSILGSATSIKGHPHVIKKQLTLSRSPTTQISAIHTPNPTCIPPPSHLLHNHHSNQHPTPCLRSRPSLCPLSLWQSHGSWPSAPTRSCPRCCHTSLPSATGWKAMAVQEPSALSPSAQVSIPPTPRTTSLHYRIFRFITKIVVIRSIPFESSMLQLR